MEQQPAAPKTGRLAMASLVLAILAFPCFSVLGSIPAVLTGHLAKRRIRRSGGSLRGGGVALSGLALGYVHIALFAILFQTCPGLTIPPALRPAISFAYSFAKKSTCGNILSALACTCKLYASDNDDIMAPSLDTLVETNYLSDRRIFLCPGQRHKEPYMDYDYFGAGQHYSALDSHCVILADRPGNHPGCVVIVFADTHAEIVEGATSLEAAMKLRPDIKLPPGAKLPKDGAPISGH